MISKLYVMVTVDQKVMQQTKRYNSGLSFSACLLQSKEMLDICYKKMETWELQADPFIRRIKDDFLMEKM